MANDVVAAIGYQAAQPTSGVVRMDTANVSYPFYHLTFTFTAARIPVTDAGASGSSGLVTSR